MKKLTGNEVCIGTGVKLATGKYGISPNNPAIGSIGVITEINTIFNKEPYLIIYVTWKNNAKNSYRIADLVLAKKNRSK